MKTAFFVLSTEFFVIFQLFPIAKLWVLSALLKNEFQ